MFLSFVVPAQQSHNFHLDYISPEKGNGGETLKNLAAFYLKTEDFHKVISYARELKALGEKLNNERFKAYANTYLGQAYLMTNQVDAAKHHLEEGLRLATTLENDSILCSAYNGLGLYATNIESDFNGSLAYFFKGLEVAKRSSFTRLYYLLLVNISGVYYLKGDETGLPYAQECYDYGHKLSDPFLVLWGALNSAYMYNIMEKYEEAIQYIKEAEFIIQNNEYKNLTFFYTVYGETLAGLGNLKEAEKYYQEALLHSGSIKSSSAANLYLNYGKLLIAQERFSEAIPLLKKGISLSEQSLNQVYIRQLYSALSDCYTGMGDFQQAYNYFTIYYAHSKRLFNEESERSINQLRVAFEVERKEIEAAQSRLEVINQTRKKQYLTGILFLTIVGSLYLYILYARQNKLYRQIIVSNKSFIKKENLLKAQIKTLEVGHTEPCERYLVSSLKEEKIQDLFRRVEYEMNERHLYRDPSLTKEKIAEILNTNRTYLSQVINERTGLNVPHYINSFRINEAIRILSDPDDTIPLKALASELGFNSTSTFYKAFQDSMGMSPSLYRKKSQELSS